MTKNLRLIEVCTPTPIDFNLRRSMCSARKFVRISVLLLSAAALFEFCDGAHAQTYKLTDLGTLGVLGGSSSATGINSAGQVVGTSGGNAVLWSGSSTTVLGIGAAYGINDLGQVVGVSQYADTNPHFGPTVSKATLWDGSNQVNLGQITDNILWPEDPRFDVRPHSSAAYAINNAGQIVGHVEAPSAADSFGNGVLWNGNTATAMSSLTDSYGINQAGEAVGNGGKPFPYGTGLHAASWADGVLTQLPSNLDGGQGVAYGINDLGQKVGWAGASENLRHVAALWNGSTWSALGPLDGTSSDAWDINNLGQAVGSMVVSGIRHATLWNGADALDLNSFLDTSTLRAGWFLADARGINDSGWIAGTALNSFTGESHAYLLAPIPEPATYALMLAGLGAVGITARRRKGATA